MNHIENYLKLDQDIVKQTHKGKGWGKEDQARYDAAIANRSQAKERATEYKDKQNTPYNSKGNTDSNSELSKYVDQNIKQDNDQSNITGDNNCVYQNQDNSVRNYGGDNHSFVYNNNGEGPHSCNDGDPCWLLRT